MLRSPSTGNTHRGESTRGGFECPRRGACRPAASLFRPCSRRPPSAGCSPDDPASRRLHRESCREVPPRNRAECLLFASSHRGSESSGQPTGAGPSAQRTLLVRDGAASNRLLPTAAQSPRTQPGPSPARSQFQNGIGPGRKDRLGRSGRTQDLSNFVGRSAGKGPESTAEPIAEGGVNSGRSGGKPGRVGRTRPSL